MSAGLHCLNLRWVELGDDLIHAWLSGRPLQRTLVLLHTFSASVAALGRVIAELRGRHRAERVTAAEKGRQAD